MKPKLRRDLVMMKIVDIVTRPPSIDTCEILQETYRDAVRQVGQVLCERWFLYPTGCSYPPSMIDSYGKDYVLNAQGIFYHDSYSQALVTGNRKVWVPSLEDVDWEADSEIGRRGRAQTVAKHSKENERRHKSEYAWEADAWSDVFGTMRNDVYVEADKHDYIRNKPNTDPVKYTFGLATFTERNPISMPGAASFGSTVWKD